MNAKAIIVNITQNIVLLILTKWKKLLQEQLKKLQKDLLYRQLKILKNLVEKDQIREKMSYLNFLIDFF